MTGIVCFHNPDEENGYLSNWYPSHFVVDDVEFSSMEQYMMYRKACCFSDAETAARILETDDVAETNALADGMAGYDDHVWNGVRQIEVYEGLLAKFRQNAELGARLEVTGIALWRNAPSKTASGASACRCMTQPGQSEPMARSEPARIRSNAHKKEAQPYRLMVIRLFSGL